MASHVCLLKIINILIADFFHVASYIATYRGTSFNKPSQINYKDTIQGWIHGKGSGRVQRVPYHIHIQLTVVAMHVLFAHVVCSFLALHLTTMSLDSCIS